ncbi:unnamed protein product [Leptidea sinapis]|uniref:Glycosyltransferase 2-like domain-containing protein n=1 Tax=Leptidea sinapis TaxID=189913 RepID=A0A5E4Q132_9NEOP|nr:unnamed protein product [Leptidea sinapis]
MSIGVHCFEQHIVSFLKQKLEDYISENVPKVKVIRLAQRSGLIAARLAGAARATADVLLFLDSHTEASPIALDYRTVVCPFIDVIAFDTFEYRAQDEGARGAFDWELSPVMAGGLFAIARKFFWELGGYDPGLDIWGGEQYELSFKIWQCGGRLVDAPCSRVGHVYRKFAPFPNPGHGDFVGKHLYRRRPHYRNLDPGDLSEQRALRTRLRCKPFRWFMTQVAFDLTAKYPPVEPAPFAQGRVRPLAEPALCVDARHAQQMQRLQLRPYVKIETCVGTFPTPPPRVRSYSTGVTLEVVTSSGDIILAWISSAAHGSCSCGRATSARRSSGCWTTWSPS